MRIAFPTGATPADVVERRYWDFDFPDAGDEEFPADIEPLVDELESVFARAVEVRLRADVPVVSYLSGGVDSAYVLATAAKVSGAVPASFTIRVPSGKLDESTRAIETAGRLGSRSTTIECGPRAIADAYPKLVTAADSPVTDTSCAALLMLAQEVHEQGFKVALTGEGADEAFAGYVWYKFDAFFRRLDGCGLGITRHVSRLARKVITPDVSFADFRRNDDLIGGPHAQSSVYGFVSAARNLYFSKSMHEQLGGHVAYEDLPFDLEKMRRWSSLNQSLYLGYKLQLPGLLLNHKGDRVAMANSVETRYPFLDNDVIKFASRLSPRLKLRGLRQDKYLLRRAAARLLPSATAQQPKGMFRAPFAESFFVQPPPYVTQLMSEESLAKTGYFDVKAVRRDYQSYATGTASRFRFFASMGLGGVLATQLWHHLNFGGLCDLPVAGSGSRPVSGPPDTHPQIVL